MGSVHIIIVQLNMSELDLNTKKDKLKKKHKCYFIKS